MAAWMLDPVVCAGMTLGAPQVDLLALFELKRLFTAIAAPPNSRRDDGFAREKVDEAAHRARVELGQTDEPDIRTQPDRRDERSGANERGGSVRLNSFRRFAKWISASIMPPP